MELKKKLTFLFNNNNNKKPTNVHQFPHTYLARHNKPQVICHHWYEKSGIDKSIDN